MLRRGSVGDAVAAVQKQLGVQQTKIFGPTTEENVTRFQRSHDLEPDGVVGAATWRQLFAPAPEPTRDVGERALVSALSYVGQREEPLGSNRGAFVDECNRLAGVPLGSFWCMSFVHRCVKEAAEDINVAIPMPRTASCSFLYRWARQHNRLTSRPEVGDIFLCIGGENGHYHTGFVATKPKSEKFQTVEGNSNDDGSANGIAVVHRIPGRRLSSCHYVRL